MKYINMINKKLSQFKCSYGYNQFYYYSNYIDYEYIIDIIVGIEEKRGNEISIIYDGIIYMPSIWLKEFYTDDNIIIYTKI